jgi:8-oxo-dGTP pyrophosphatase MutT (NUDIX family)
MASSASSASPTPSSPPPVLFLQPSEVPRGPALTEEIIAGVTDRLRRLHRFRLSESGARRAAVLLPLANYRSEACVLLTLRASRLSTHAAQVSFPGGHIDAGETEEDAARREFAEEIGSAARARAARLCGLFHDSVAVTGTHVHTVVGWFGELDDGVEDFAPNAAEVDTAFTVPLRALVDPSIFVLEDLSARMTKRKDAIADERLRTRAVTRVPAFYVPGAPARVWGLTGFLLENFLRHVLIPAFRDAGVTEADLPNLPTPEEARVIAITE